MHYCNKNGLPQTKILPPPGGSAGLTETAKDNWITADQVIQKVATYGRPDAIQPYVYEHKHSWDALYLDQVGEHFYGVLYLHSRQLALVADGSNSIPQDIEAMEILQEDFAPATLKLVKFMGQNRDDRYGAAAAAILIELQKAYEKQELPTELYPEKAIYGRIERSLHKVKTPKITAWKPIHEQRIGTSCPKCGQKLRRAKSRGFLNLHSCKLE